MLGKLFQISTDEKQGVDKKKQKAEIDSAASSGDQRKYSFY